MIKLSFIVPVYNVEMYLRKCVDTLLAQDYDDYEIILVDDGSTDNSGTICDEYSTLYTLHHTSYTKHQTPEIRVIHQVNSGLSAARNTGIAAAKGKYICFVDSDDYWEPNVLAGLMSQIERDNLDVLRFKYQNVNEKYEVYNPYKRDHRLDDDYSESVTDGVSFLNSRFGTACYAVMFILRRDLVYTIHHTPYTVNSSVLFTLGIYFEDTDWTPRMLCKAKRVASTETVVYNYLIREGSITNAVNRSKKQKVLDDKIRLIRIMQQQALDLHKSGRYNNWYKGMISAFVISIIETLSVEFYAEKDYYLAQLQKLNVYPIAATSFKTRLINLSPRFAIELLHIKNS